MKGPIYDQPHLLDSGLLVWLTALELTKTNMVLHDQTIPKRHVSLPDTMKAMVDIPYVNSNLIKD